MMLSEKCLSFIVTPLQFNDRRIDVTILTSNAGRIRMKVTEM